MLSWLYCLAKSQVDLFEYMYAGIWSICLKQNPYAGSDWGAVTGWIYGPLNLAVYSPFCLVSNPVAIAMGISVASFLLTMVPLAWICFGFSPRRDYRAGFLLLSLAVSVLYLFSPGVPFRVVDTTPEFFAGLGILLLTRGSWRAGTVLVALSVFAKQTYLPLIALPPALALVRQDWRLLARVSVTLVLTFVLAAGLCQILFGGAIWLNMLWMPARHPWLSSLTTFQIAEVPNLLQRLHVLIAALFEFFSLTGALLVAVGALLFHLFYGADLRSRTRPLLVQIGLASLLAAVLLLPTSLMGRVKMGGAINNYGGCIYFLGFSLIAFLRHSVEEHRDRVGSWVVRVAAVVLALACLAVLGSRLAFYRKVPPHTTLADATRYLEKHSDIYFAFHPLAHMTQQGRTTHVLGEFEFRKLAGMAVKGEHLRAHLPPDFKRVAFFSDRTCEMTEEYLEGRLIAESPLPELPGQRICRLAPR